MITQADLIYWFDYDPEAGVFYWKRRPARGGQNRKVGDIAGTVNAGRYPRRVLWLKKGRIVGARAAWIMTHGPLPERALVDHIDGDTTNDRISNLRIANAAQNTWNRLQREGTKFKMGASKDERGRYKARIQIPGGRKINLGTWHSETEAHAAYMGAAAILH
jgi:hypothetical protein